MEYESHIAKNPFFIIARMSRKQIHAMSKEELQKLAEKIGISRIDYDPDAPLELRVGWLASQIGEGGE